MWYFRILLLSLSSFFVQQYKINHTRTFNKAKFFMRCIHGEMLFLSDNRMRKRKKNVLKNYNGNSNSIKYLHLRVACTFLRCRILAFVLIFEWYCIWNMCKQQTSNNHPAHATLRNNRWKANMSPRLNDLRSVCCVHKSILFRSVWKLISI